MNLIMEIIQESNLSKTVVQILSGVDVAGLVDALIVSPTRAANLKHKIYYFLSLITDTNDNCRLNERTGGFHKLCSGELKKVIGSKDFYVIRELLLNPEDPIIEVDNCWHNPNGANSSGFCQGYRISPKYNTGEVIYKTLSGRFVNSLARYHASDKEAMKNCPDYKFLLDKFKTHSLKFDPKVYEFIYSFGSNLLNRVHEANPYQIKLIHNLVGRWLYYVEQIQSDNIWSTVSVKNHRLNSSVTNLPKLLRPFLLCNNQQLQCVDISSSQPYILSSVIQSRFYQEIKEGYNLNTIYPELYEELVYNGSIDTSITYSSNIDIQHYITNTGYTTNYYLINISNSSSFMWCSFFTTTEIDSINRYTQSPFYMDFYTHVIDRYYTHTNAPKKTVQKDDRDKLKSTMMYVLFDDNQNHRNNNQQIQIFQKVFPGVDKWITQIHKLIGKQQFSYLLQRSESYLLLAVICREFNELHPTAPLFTIHDGVFTIDKYVRILNGFVLKRLKELTRVMAGCKIKTSQINPNPQIKDVETEWTKIKSIDTEEKYIKNRNGIFSSNIQRGSDFLEKFWQEFFEGY